MNGDPLSLFGFFANNFSIATIYDLGWQASKEWAAVVSGVLLVIAIGIRMLEEGRGLLSSSGTKWVDMVVTVCLVSIAYGLYFVIADLIIDFFLSIYGVLKSSDALSKVGEQLDLIMVEIRTKDYSFKLSDVINGAYFIFAMVAYCVTFGILVFVTIFMRIAHALMVTFALFWGIIALPMSITQGIKMLQPLRTVAITALIWPIIDAFAMFVIAGAMMDALDKAKLTIDSTETWDVGILLFYISVFSIINILLTATTLVAPFLAQGMANGTGSVTGLIAGFGGAGVAAGAVAGKMLANRIAGGMNAGGAALGDLAGKAGGKINQALYPPRPAPGVVSRNTKYNFGGENNTSSPNRGPAMQSSGGSETPVNTANSNSGSNPSTGPAMQSSGGSETPVNTANMQSSGGSETPVNTAHSNSGSNPSTGPAMQSSGGSETPVNTAHSNSGSNPSTGPAMQSSGGSETPVNTAHSNSGSNSNAKSGSVSTPNSGPAEKKTSYSKFTKMADGLNDQQMQQFAAPGGAQAENVSGPESQPKNESKTKSARQARRGAIINKGK